MVESRRRSRPRDSPLKHSDDQLTIEYMAIFPHHLLNSPTPDVDLIVHWGASRDMLQHHSPNTDLIRREFRPHAPSPVTASGEVRASRLNSPLRSRRCASRKVVTPVNPYIPAITSRSGGSKACTGRSWEGRLQGLLDQHCDGVNERLRLSTPGADFIDIKMDKVHIIALLPLIK
jgi:hypothetical protein